MNKRQSSLFSDKDLRETGTKIKPLKEYIGREVDAIEASTFYKGHRKGIVRLIEKTEINGYDSYRVELDTSGSLGFGSIEEIVNFFESELKLTEFDFNSILRDEKICFVSYSDNEASFLYSELKNIDPRIASISVESLCHFRGYKFFSLNRNINYRGYKIQRVTLLKDDFYQVTKYKENSKIFHIIKNGELLTVCGKSLDCHIDTQDFSPFITICSKCSSSFSSE